MKCALVTVGFGAESTRVHARPFISNRFGDSADEMRHVRSRLFSAQFGIELVPLSVKGLEIIGPECVSGA